LIQNELKKLLARLHKVEYVLLFLDFDGTLAPLQKAHQKSTLAANRKVLLKKLTDNKKFKVILISGRAVQFLKSRINLKNIYYVGNHGLEISGPDFRFQMTSQLGWEKRILMLTKDLNELVKNHPGVTVEPKGLSVALHYRGLKAERVEKFRNAVKKFEENLSPSLKMISGKKIYEFRPNTKEDKGTAVKKILKRFQGDSVLSLYIGDDLTDEAGFKAVNPKGHSIRVGFNNNSQAEYYLKNPNEVYFFLKSLTTDDSQ